MQNTFFDSKGRFVMTGPLRGVNSFATVFGSCLVVRASAFTIARRGFGWVWVGGFGWVGLGGWDWVVGLGGWVWVGGFGWVGLGGWVWAGEM